MLSKSSLVRHGSDFIIIGTSLIDSKDLPYHILKILSINSRRLSRLNFLTDLLFAMLKYFLCSVLAHWDIFPNCFFFFFENRVYNFYVIWKHFWPALNTKSMPLLTDILTPWALLAFYHHSWLVHIWIVHFCNQSIQIFENVAPKTYTGDYFFLFLLWLVQLWWSISFDQSAGTVVLMGLRIGILGICC